MASFSSSPGARRLLVISIVARLPLTTLSIGLLVHARHLTGSFADAGIVAGGFASVLGSGAVATESRRPGTGTSPAPRR